MSDSLIQRAEEIKEKSIAPSLSEFLKEGGAEKYIPRPEWCRHSAYDCYETSYSTISRSRSSLNSIETFYNSGVQIAANNKCQWEKGLILDLSEFNAMFRNFSSGDTEKSMESNEDNLSRSPRSVTQHQTKHIPDIDDEDCENQVSNVLFTSDTMEQDKHVFGSDKNSALIVAIKEKNSSAAMKLIQYGSNPNYRNRHGVTPLILAAQKGLLDVAIFLLKVGANPCEASLTTTPLIQASHFGHYEIVKALLEQGALVNQTNQKGTTALMRACQEGHVNISKLLISHHADIEHKNQDDMNALMLASQRGNLDVVQILLRQGSRVNEITLQHSTALMLACKRGHVDVVKALMSHGAELCMRDYRGRTATSIAENNARMTSFVPFMTLDTQMFLLRKKASMERNMVLVKMWKLFNENRASITSWSEAQGCIRVTNKNTHDESILSRIEPAKQAIIRTMSLPLPLVGIVANFLQYPILIEKHWEILSRRRRIDPTSTIACALDLIDDILENVGFVEACDTSLLVAPTGFLSWSEWKLERLNQKRFENADSRIRHSMSSSTSRPFSLLEKQIKTKDPLYRYLYSLRLRRQACFLQILAHRSANLSHTLVNDYKIPRSLLKRLKNNSDIQSIFVRLGTSAIRFHELVADEITELTCDLVRWFRMHESSSIIKDLQGEKPI